MMHFELDVGFDGGVGIGKKGKMKGKAVAGHQLVNNGYGEKQQQQTVSSSPRCQVEGCNLDLSGAKSYYCKHKVCGLHSKAPKVIVSGVEQRFCQQCSRFHLLAEFDQRKRSCRRRLADHNERRRKPPPEFLASQFGQLSSSFHEDNNRFRGFVVDFTNPRLPERRQDDGKIYKSIDKMTDNQWHNFEEAAHANVASQQGHLHLQVSTDESAFSFLSTQKSCHFGGSDTCYVLSLLSTEQRASSRNTRQYMAISASNSNLEENRVTQIATGSNYIANSSGLTSNGLINNSIPQVAALQQVPQTENGSSFLGELELALQGSHQNLAFDFNRTCGQSNSFFNLYP